MTLSGKNGFGGFFKQGVITAVTTALLITPASEGSKAIMSGGKELISEIRTQVEQKQLPAADLDASVESSEETSESQ